MKKCPFCSEEIQDEAVKCKHCGEFLNKTTVSTAEQKVGEGFGLAMLLIPLSASFLVWFWVGGMALIEGPGSKLNLLIAITVIGTSIFCAIEANKLGMGNPSDVNKKGKRNSGPIGWFFAMSLLWIVAYPAYLWTRSRYGLKNYLVLGIFIAAISVASFGAVSFMIYQEVSKLQKDIEEVGKGFEQVGKAFQESITWGGDPQEILQGLSIASELYAIDNGSYPSEISELMPDYLNKNFCNTITNGYTYKCYFLESGYEFTAIPVEQGELYSVTTGGIFR